MKIGFLGVGTIASCVIEGFCGLGDEHEFFLSPRNKEKSAALAAKYKNVQVCESNQQAVSESDTVFISMLAHNCIDVLKELKFKPTQQIINVVATIPPEDILRAIGEVGGFSHCIPLPSVKCRQGPIAVYPESTFIKDLLSPLGTVVFGKTMDEVRTMQAITALMSSFYEMLSHLSGFAEKEGLHPADSAAFMTAFFASLCYDKADADFHELAMEMTPGGLNELALTTLTNSGAIKAWADVMEPVMKRIK